jgi:hypothetical protein
MKHGQIGIGPLFPANEDAPKSVHPAVCAFDHPASGLEACILLDRLRLFAPAPAMSGESELLCQRPDFGVVVSLIETQSLR